MKLSQKLFMIFYVQIILVLTLFVSVLFATQDTPLFPPYFSDGFKVFDGHLKPFGWQRKPEGKIKEYYEVLTPQKFHENHVRTKIPLVFRNAIKKSPALLSWTDDYLNKTYGDLDVLVEMGKENRSFTTGRMRFKKFLELYKSKKLYVVSLLPEEMMKDVQAVSSVLCGTFRNFTHESNLWMSNGGTRSVIHYDADENLHCLLAGRKDFITVENKFQKSLYFHDLEETAGSSFSDIDPDLVDLEKYLNVMNVPWTYTTLYAGDCVYLPSRYIHQVRSYGRTVAVTTLFTNGLSAFLRQDLGYDPKGCEEFDVNRYYSMNEIDFHWSYEKGDKTIDMGYMNIETIRIFLLRSAKALQSLNFERFQSLFDGFNFGEGTKDAKTVFNTLTEGKKELTVSDIRALSRQKLKYLGRSMDPPHGPQADDGGIEVFFMPGDMSEDHDHDKVKYSSKKRREFQEEIEEIEHDVHGIQAGSYADAFLNVLKDEKEKDDTHYEL